MNAETTTPGAAELVAGFLAVISIAASVVALFWEPLRLSPFAVLLALVSVVMSRREARLPLAAAAIGAICFLAGMTIAATTNNPFY